MKKKIYLIDANSFIYRMFFALPEFSRKDGKIVNAVFGMAKFFTGQMIRENPDYLIFIKDAKWKNFRHDLYEDYKATRDKMPDNLKSQIQDIEDMVSLMNIDIIAIPGYEADDVIATLAHKYNWDENYEVDILSWDKDLYALVSENVKIYDTMKRKKFGPDETREKFGIDAKHVVDYLAIVGDSADNIPGIAGFWPGKAVPLLNAIWNIEEIYSRVEQIESWMQIEELLESVGEDYKKPIKSCFSGKTYEKLLAGRDDAFLSKKLATLDLLVDLDDFKLENFAFKKQEIHNPQVLSFFREYEFFSLAWEEEKQLKKWEDLWLTVQIIWDSEWLAVLEKKILKSKEIVLDTETTSLSIIEAELVWLSIYIDDQNIYYINRLHRWPKISDDILKLFIQKILKIDITIVWHNLKYDLQILELYLSSNHTSTSQDEQMSLGL